MRLLAESQIFQSLSAWYSESRILQQLRRHPAGLFMMSWIFFGCVLCLLPAEIYRGSIFLMALYGLGYWLVRRVPAPHQLWCAGLLLSACLVRLVVALTLYAAAPTSWLATPMGLFQNGGFWVGDGFQYAFNGFWLAEQWRIGIYPTMEALSAVSISMSGSAYDYWNGLLCFLFGYHPLIPILINALAGAGSGILAFLLARRLLPVGGAKAVALLTAFWPSLLLWSTQNLKEPITVFLLLSLLCCFLVPLKKHRLLYWPLGTVLFGLLNQINYFIAPLILLSVPVYFTATCLLRYVRRGRWRPWVVAGLFFLLLLPVVQTQFIRLGTATIEFYMTHPLIDRQVATNPFLEWAEYLRRVRMFEARTPLLESMELTSLWAFLRFVPIGLAAVLTLPVPWAVRSALEGIGSLEMILWYPLLIGALYGMFLSIRRGPIEKILLCMVLSMAFAMALLEGNVGTLFRHRAALWPLLFIFACIGLTNFLRLQVSDK